MKSRTRHAFNRLKDLGTWLRAETFWLWVPLYLAARGRCCGTGEARR